MDTTVELNDYEFACLIGKLAADIGHLGGMKDLSWDHEMVKMIHEKSMRLAALTEAHEKSHRI